MPPTFKLRRVRREIFLSLWAHRCAVCGRTEEACGRLDAHHLTRQHARDTTHSRAFYSLPFSIFLPHIASLSYGTVGSNLNQRPVIV